MSHDYQQIFREAILGDREALVEASFRSRPQDDRLPWLRVTLRPVLIKGIRQVQFSYFEVDRSITKNHTGEALKSSLEELLALPYRNLQLRTVDEQIRVQISKKGKAIIHRQREPRPQRASLAHDRKKSYLLADGDSDPFLRAIGITNADGSVKAKMQRKFRQINQFLKLVDETVQLDGVGDRPVRVIDFGCGNAYLTFAVYHYLNRVRELPTDLVGVDIKDQFVETHARKMESLGWDNISFQATRIIDYRPEISPDIVLALHACDTATDEALAQGIRSESQHIFCAPCCHHHLQQQLTQKQPPSPFLPVMRHGILKERMGDILTDSFRALILRAAGYATDVIEFVSTEHTPRNLLIRAVRSRRPDSQAAVREYEEMKAYWGVEPYLERLLEPGALSGMGK
jgi:SAM-dependent methyltransferase